MRCGFGLFFFFVTPPRWHQSLLVTGVNLIMCLPVCTAAPVSLRSQASICELPGFFGQYLRFRIHFECEFHDDGLKTSWEVGDEAVQR